MCKHSKCKEITTTPIHIQIPGLTELTLGPQLDGPQSQPETVLIGHEVENSVSHPTAIETAHTLRIEVFEQCDVQKI